MGFVLEGLLGCEEKKRKERKYLMTLPAEESLTPDRYHTVASHKGLGKRCIANCLVSRAIFQSAQCSQEGWLSGWQSRSHSN